LSKQKPCPPKLREVIELVNRLPPGAELPALRVKTADASLGDASEWTKEARFDLHRCLADLPEDFRRYIYADRLPTYSPVIEAAAIEEDYSGLWRETYAAVERYANFARLRWNFRLLLRSINNRLSHDAALWKGVPLPAFGSTTFTVDERGTIHVARDLLSEALDGIEAKRVGECEVCRLVFWAGRSDQICCSPKCANVYRVRRSRENKKESAEIYRVAAKKRRR
jgi:hypothetical protein